MHDDRKLSGDRNRSTLEAHSLTQLEPPSSEATLISGTGSREDHDRRFIKEPPQMVIRSHVAVQKAPLCLDGAHLASVYSLMILLGGTGAVMSPAFDAAVTYRWP